MLQKRSHRKVLQKLDSTVVRRDLRYLAQLLNSNYRRRMERSSRREANNTKDDPLVQAEECSSRIKDQSLEPAIAQHRHIGTDARRPNLSSPESAVHEIRRAGHAETANEFKNHQISHASTTMMLIVQW